MNMFKLDKMGYYIKYFFYENMFMGSHYTCQSEVLLMSTHNMFLWKYKKNINAFYLVGGGGEKSSLSRVPYLITNL